MPEPPSFGGDSSQSDVPAEFSDFGNQYINTIPEQDRGVVAKYIKDWDARVTKEFQTRAEEIKSYKSLGDPTTLAAAREAYNMLQQDPVAFYQYLNTWLMDQGMLENSNNQQQQPDPAANSGLPEFEGVPKEFVQQFSELKNMVTAMHEGNQKQMQAAQEKQQMEMLDNVLKDMHTTHGDFPDEVILAQLAQGKSPEQAIEAWNKIKQGVIDSRQSRPTPPLLPGSGNTPLDQVDKAKLRDPKVRKELGAAFLKANLGQS